MTPSRDAKLTIYGAFYIGMSTLLAGLAGGSDVVALTAVGIMGSGITVAIGFEEFLSR